MIGRFVGEMNEKKLVVYGERFFLWEAVSFCNCPSVSVSQCLSVLVSIVEEEGELQFDGRYVGFSDVLSQAMA